MKEYIVDKKAGRFYVGQKVNDSDIRVRRLLQEGDCLKPYKKEVDVKENKMEKMNYENKGEK